MHLCALERESITVDGPVGSAGWTVTLDAGDQVDYDGVLVASGHLWDQKIPAMPGAFTGAQYHSGSYRNTGDIEGTRVPVVGAGKWPSEHPAAANPSRQSRAT